MCWPTYSAPGQTALYIAARTGNLNAVQKLLEIPSLNIDLRMQSNKATALHGKFLFFAIACAYI